MSGGAGAIVVVLGISVGLIVLAAIISAATSGVKAHDAEVMVRGEPADVLTDIRLAVSAVSGHETRQDVPSTLSIRFPVTPGWVPFACVLLFPIGLLALMAKRVEVATIVAEPSGALTRLRIGGRFDPIAIGRINGVIESRS